MSTTEQPPVPVRSRYQRPKVDAPSSIMRLMGLPGAGTTAIKLMVDGHLVPYVTGTEWQEYSPEAAEQFEDRAPELRAAIERGEPIYSLTLDDRFGLTVPESELERWAWFLANAMAVAAGYTSHGENSRPINRHGPSRV